MSKNEPPPAPPAEDEASSNDFLAARTSARLHVERTSSRAREGRWRRWLVVAAALFLAPVSAGIAASPALRANGIKFFTQSSTPGAGSSTAPVVYFDTTATAPRMQVDNGTGVYDIRGGVFDVKAYGAKGDGATNDSTAIQAAVTAACVAGGVVNMPPGTYYMTTGVTAPCSYVRIVGAGPQATIVKFDPVGTASAFKFGTVSETNMTGLSGLRFNSTGTNVQAKTAVEFYDVSQPYLEDVWVDPTNSSTWTGGNSTGIWLRGREAGTFRRFRAYCDRPIRISDDPNTAGVVDDDHMHFTDMYLRPTPSSGNAAVLIDDGGVIITNLTMDGYQAWIVDKYGLYWSQTSGATSHDNVLIQGVRCEQAVDPTGYCVFIDTSTILYNLGISDLETTVSHNGVHLNGVSNATIKNSIFVANSNANTHLDIGATLYDLVLDNNFVNSSALTNLGSLNKIWAAPQRQASATMPSSARYTNLAGSMSTVTLNFDSGMSVSGEAITNNNAANGGPLTINTANTFSGGNQMVAFTNNNTLEAYLDNAGDLYSVGGLWDTTGATQAKLCNNNCSSLVLGRSGASAVFVSAPLIEPGTAGGAASGSTSLYWSKIVAQHYTSSGTAPTTAVGAGGQLGTSPACTVSGNDAYMTVTITTGTTPSAFVANTAVTACTITFNATYGATPKSLVVDEANSTAAAIKTGTSGINFYADSAASSATTAVIKAVSSGTPTLAASTAYIVYLSVGT